MSDKQFFHGVVVAAKTLSVHAPVYLYYFTFEGDFQVNTYGYTKLNISLTGNKMIR